jgi:hypothetical protein
MTHRTSTYRLGLLAVLAAAGLAAAPPARASDRKESPKGSVLRGEVWKTVSLTPVKPAEIDALVAGELKSLGVAPAPRTGDEQFLRRVTLDLTGELPAPAEVAAFAKDADPAKRAKAIDRLLDSEKYARHWARYWREVIAAKTSDRRGQALARPFETWMTTRLKENTPWDEVARAMITASGPVPFADDGGKGAAYFLLAYSGNDAISARTAETSRVFLGIQIQCAQCHDHPSDVWKREQFHELAGFFARVRERQMREEQRVVGIELASLPRGEHQMPSKDNPRRGTPVSPRFLDGKGPRAGAPDEDRRAALADAVTSKENYWFAAAYVNRTWGELMGQSFYTPVDDMGPAKDAVMPAVLTRLAASFRATDYDTKALFRAVLNSDTYQRQIRLGESTNEHLHFAAAYPTRLRADALWESLVGVLGPIGGPGGGGRPRPGAGGAFGGRFGLQGVFMEEFRFDPSTPADEVEGSIPQALMLMNNPAIHQRIQARGNTVLADILSANPQDDDAIRAVYLRALARQPSDRELAKCRDYVKKVGSRAEAFEDLLWALLNSTEFQTKR